MIDTKTVAKVARRTALADLGRFADPPEAAPDVGSVQRSAKLCGED
jgi:hypothetical protein